MDRNKQTRFIKKNTFKSIFSAKKKSLALYLLLCTTITSYALIIESNKLSAVLDYIDSPNTLVIFDIDNTIAHPIEELGSDEWFCHLVNQRLAMGYDPTSSVYYVLPAYFYAQFNVPLQPTETIIQDLIEHLTHNNIVAMALSARNLFIAERTLEQLENINITFPTPNINPQDLVLPMQHPCFYKQGILFAGNNDKGKALNCFFNIMNYYPKKVVFVDDKMKYLLAVEKALEELNIEFCGIRYSGCDERVKNFDPVKAEQQYRELRERNG